MNKYLTIADKEYTLSTDPSKLDVQSIHQFLSEEAYWSPDIPIETVQKAIDNSLCFGIYQGDNQAGFARIISDRATIAYLGDVFIRKEYRGIGLSKWLVESIMSHPELQGLRRWVLLTGDAHELYRQFGWKNIADPTLWMEVHDKNVYQKD